MPWSPEYYYFSGSYNLKKPSLNCQLRLKQPASPRAGPVCSEKTPVNIPHCSRTLFFQALQNKKNHAGLSQSRPSQPHLTLLTIRVSSLAGLNYLKSDNTKANVSQLLAVFYFYPLFILTFFTFSF